MLVHIYQHLEEWSHTREGDGGRLRRRCPAHGGGILRKRKVLLLRTGDAKANAREECGGKILGVALEVQRPGLRGEEADRGKCGHLCLQRCCLWQPNLAYDEPPTPTSAEPRRATSPFTPSEQLNNVDQFQWTLRLESWESRAWCIVAYLVLSPLRSPRTLVSLA